MLHPLFQEIFDTHFPMLNVKPISPSEVCYDCGSTSNIEFHKPSPFIAPGKYLCVPCRLGLR